MNTTRQLLYPQRPALAGRCFTSLIFVLALFLAGTSNAQEEDNPLDPPNGNPDSPNGAQLSDSQSAYIGARLLCGPDASSPRCPKASRGQVNYQRLAVGSRNDHEARDRYAFWQGDTLYAAVEDLDGGNRVDAIIEFYWFESSAERGSDFYVAILKVASAPAPTTTWRIATPPSFADQVLAREIGPTQRVVARTDPSGNFGAIRWDWSVPYESYDFDAERQIEIEQKYSAGVNSEGTAMRNLTEGVDVQAKGFFNAETNVSSRYTITLWRWQMTVQPGGTEMQWDLNALNPEREHHAAYHEYFLVLQAPRGREVRLESLDFSATFRNRRGGLLDYAVPDEFHDVSVRIDDIVLTPPQVANCPEGFGETDAGCIPICAEGFKPLNGECIPDCPDGFEASGEDCIPVCQDGYEVRGNRCQPICADHERYYRGRCIPYCDESERVDGDACVPVCGDGLRMDGSDCVSVCDDGERFENNRCVSLCEDGQIFRNGGCVEGCQNGFELVNGECRRSCPTGSHYEGTSCVPDCGPGFRATSGRCVLDCPAGSREVNGRCERQNQCPVGTRLLNGQCTSIDTSGVTTSPESMKQSADAEGGCSTVDGHPIALLALLSLLGLMRRRPTH